MSFSDDWKMREGRIMTVIERQMTSLSVFSDYRASVPVCGATKQVPAQPAGETLGNCSRDGSYFAGAAEP
jgi:hypothetical protein